MSWAKTAPGELLQLTVESVLPLKAYPQHAPEEQRRRYPLQTALYPVERRALHTSLPGTGYISKAFNNSRMQKILAVPAELNRVANPFVSREAKTKSATHQEPATTCLKQANLAETNDGSSSNDRAVARQQNSPNSITWLARDTNANDGAAKAEAITTAGINALNVIEPP
ncbi:hypothetical protein [Burkholderia sp. Leaf177]|uniref:hypothetical protein n=1 Tax=Burkholderia sp. Leaf177 TaxID=1736287 RepID=UPI0012E37F88|nr:hypothetical protein [Burkholderia sp. Leaf177]